jgi:ppGpp synthetase/RelA/SpoT-type nucleotidyltranferase
MTRDVIMNADVINTDAELKNRFSQLQVQYHNLASVLKGGFEDLLNFHNIGYARVLYRIKTYDSFEEKIRRKKYKSPFSEIDDICGFRIVIRNAAEIDKLVEIIEREFDIRESQNKDVELSPDQFGYRSHHIVASIKKEWMAAPQYRNYTGLKFEIQIRSELMDSWANISHQIFYRKDSLSKNVRRRLYRLSALMEIGDSEISQLIQRQSNNDRLPPKMKALQDVLDQYLPERKRAHENPLAVLLNEMETYNFPLETLIKYLETQKDKLLKIEEEAFSQVKSKDGIESRWWQIGFVRGFMYLTIDEYWLKEGTQYSEHFISVIESYRQTFKKLPKHEN